MVCFQTKNPNLGKILEGLRMKNVCVFYDHLEYFTAIWYSLWSFGILFTFWYVWTKKNLATLPGHGSSFFNFKMFFRPKDLSDQMCDTQKRNIPRAVDMYICTHNDHVVAYV
jgi:hypothetical protein